jgi:CRP-like cAMP-binding protein
MRSDRFIPGNRLLACLPRETVDRLAPDIEAVPMRRGEILHEAGRVAAYVYFPITGMGSIVTHLQGGVQVESASVGNEGMLGLPHVLGYAPATQETTVRVPGEALRLSRRALRTEFDRDEQIRLLLMRYSQLSISQMAQNVACNRFHHINARCARWLLSMDDRVEGDQFALTHEALAMMLGVRRAGVSVAQHKLLKAGLISYSRGTVTIINRQGLESAACECYGVVRQCIAQFYAQPQLAQIAAD